MSVPQPRSARVASAAGNVLRAFGLEAMRKEVPRTVGAVRRMWAPECRVRWITRHPVRLSSSVT
jgi:hypothetical protein